MIIFFNVLNECLVFSSVKQNCVCKYNIRKHKGRTSSVKMLTEYQEWSERVAFVIFIISLCFQRDNEAKKYPINLQDFVRILYARDVIYYFF